MANAVRVYEDSHGPYVLWTSGKVFRPQASQTSQAGKGVNTFYKIRFPAETSAFHNGDVVTVTTAPTPEGETGAYVVVHVPKGSTLRGVVYEKGLREMWCMHIGPDMWNPVTEPETPKTVRGFPKTFAIIKVWSKT